MKRSASRWLIRTLGQLGHLLRHDARLVGRDPLLAFVLVYVVIIALALRWGWPALERWLLAVHGLDWVPYRPLVVGVVALMFGGIFVGMVIGFLVLDEKEAGTLRALRVTPLPFGTYLLYRVSVPVVLGALLTPLLIVIMDLGSPPWPVVAWIVLANAPLAALGTLAFPTLADDRVQAFAYAKIFSAVTSLPVFALFLDPPWRYLTGIFPGTWNVLALRAAQRGEPWVLLLALGGVTGWLALAWMVVYFQKTVARS